MKFAYFFWLVDKIMARTDTKIGEKKGSHRDSLFILVRSGH